MDDQQDEYRRILEDLEMCETDYDLMDDEMRALEARGLGDGDKEWEDLDYEMNQKQNEIMYLQACLGDFDAY